MSNFHWARAPFSAVAEVVTGSTPSTLNPSLYGGSVPFVTPGDLDTSVPILTTGSSLSSAGVDASRLLPTNSVLVCCIGSLGKVGFLGTPAATNQQINSLIFDESKVLPRYGYHYCRTLGPSLIAMAPATTLKIVNKSRFSTIKIPLPPLPEQRRIAAILDHADALRAKRRAAIAKLDSLAQSIFLDMFGDPVQNNRQLKTSTLGELGDWQSGGTPPRGEAHYFGGDIPWFSSGELEGPFINRSNENVTRDAMTETSAKLVSPNSLMLGMYDTAALKASIAGVSCSCNQAIAFSLLNPQKAEVLFVYFVILLGREHFRRLQRGVRQKNLNLEMIRAIEFPLPSIAAQRVFVEHYKQILKLKSKIEKSADTESELLGSLQHRAFQGTL